MDDALSPDSNAPLIRRILIATDGSAGSTRAAEYGASLAERFGADVVIVHAINLPSAFSLGVNPPAIEVDEALEHAASRSIQAAAEVVERHGLTHTDVVEHGAPANVILDAVAAQDVDLVVVGSQGHGAVQRFLLGSVSTRVLHHADCAVLVAPS